MSAKIRLAPGLLIATPSVQGIPFERSVILMLEHDQEGALGLVMNCELDIPCALIAEQLALPWPSSAQENMLLGGPVQRDSLWLLHEDRWAFPETLRIGGGLAVSRSKLALSTLGEAKSERVRFFLGYSGWGGEQIIDEIREGSWLTAPLDPALLFDTAPAKLWDAALRALGIESALLISEEGALQ